MLTIQINLLWNRYHAHPWGQNPGRTTEAEWPPSPWRLLRALAAAWFRTYPGQAVSPELKTLLETLARKLPLIGVGKVSFARAVHYQPNYRHSASNAAFASYGRVRHENLFAVTADPICFRWIDIELASEQQKLLAALLENVTYFGRADSICEATLISGGESSNQLGWCEPCFDRDNKIPQRRIAQDCRAVFCPNPCDFQATDLWLLRTKDASDEDVPLHFVNQLLGRDMCADGGVLVSYKMPSGWPKDWEVRTARRTKPSDVTISPSEGEKVAHYLRFSLQCRIPVATKFAVPLSEMFRGSAIYWLKKLYGEAAGSPAISGKDENGVQLRTHRHAYYLPLGHDASQPGTLTDLHIWCPHGFTKAEMGILQRIRQLRWGNGRFPINPILIGAAKQLPPGLPFLGNEGACVWESVTPFVPPRNFYNGTIQKPRFKKNDLPEIQLAECLRNNGITTPVTIERITLPENPDQCHWDIVRVPQDDIGKIESPFENSVAAEIHKNSGDTSSSAKLRRIGFFFRLTFAEPVSGPLFIGHSCHFGLGLFAAVPEASG